MGILRKFTAARLPAELADALPLDPGERVLAWSPLLGGGAVAATVRGLRARTPLGRTVHRDWSDVQRASWDAASGTLAVSWVDSRQVTPLELTAAGRLPDVVHERVRSSVVLSREIELPGGRAVWVALRRSADGSVVTQAVPSPGVRLDEPGVAAAVRRAEQALRDDVGAVDPPGAHGGG